MAARPSIVFYAKSGVPGRVMRPKLRFIGITHREKTSPNAFRWQQHAEWTSRLPASSVLNVSLPAPVWGYFGNTQPKMTASFTSRRWADAAIASPRRDPVARKALAAAVAIVEHGDPAETRTRYGRRTDDDRALATRTGQADPVALNAAARQSRRGAVAYFRVDYFCVY